MPDRYRIIIRPQASQDLQEIFDFIERQSPQNASLVASEIMRAIDSLQKTPNRFKIYRHARGSNPAVHAMSVRPFIVYYNVSEQDLLVNVLAIRRGTRRQPKRFN
jgi:plasmid stabilization system protein ParE